MFFSPSKAALHISSQHISLAVLRRKRNAYRIGAMRVLPLPEGLVRPSPLDLNISDADAFRGSLEELLGPHRRHKRMALSLPDLCVRAGIVTAKHEGLKRSDLESLIRLQLERLFLSSLGDCKLSYHLLSPADRTFLAVAIDQRILAQYEEPLRALGVEPVWANIASFQLFNLYQDFLSDQSGSSPCMVLNFLDRNFTLLIAAEGRLQFVRIKGLVFSESDLEGERADRSDKTERELLFDRIVKELNTSLSFYHKSQDLSAIGHLFVCGGQVSDLLKRLYDAYHIEVELLEPERLGFLQGLNQVRPEELLFVTPAIGAAIECDRALSFSPFSRMNRPK